MNEWKRGTFTYDAVGLSHTTTNIINAFTSFLTQAGWVVPAWSVSATSRYFMRSDHGSSDVWHFLGDGPTQKGGLFVFVSGNSIRIRAALENTTADGAQASTASTQEIVITVDNTTPNNYLLIGGEFGLYVEAGRDGQPNNLGHGFVATFLPIPEYYGTKDTQRKWVTQGFCCDLTGTLKFSTNRTGTQLCFITNDGSNRVFSAQFALSLMRGSADVYTNAQANSRTGYLSHRKNIISLGAGASGLTPNLLYSTFGMAWLSATNNSRYVLSGMLFAPCVGSGMSAFAESSAPIATGSVTGTPGLNACVDGAVFWRKVEKFAVVEYTLTPWANITDAVSGKAYRVANVPDGGRTAKVAVEWPDISNAVTVSLT